MADLPDFTQSVAGITTQLLTNSFINPTVTFNVASWSSVIVQLGALSALPLVAAYEFLDSSQTVVLDQGTLACGQQQNTPGWTLPVTGPFLRIINSTGNGGLIVRAFGSSVQSPKRLNYDWEPVRSLLAVVTNGTPSLTVSQLLDTTTDPMIQNATSYNGAVVLYWNFANLGGATSWHLLLEYMTLDGNTHNTQIAATSAVGAVVLNFGHPFAFTRWFVQNIGALTATINATLLIVPAEAP
jgi:hypothetical protein